MPTEPTFNGEVCSGGTKTSGVAPLLPLCTTKTRNLDLSSYFPNSFMAKFGEFYFHALGRIAFALSMCLSLLDYRAISTTPPKRARGRRGQRLARPTADCVDVVLHTPCM